MPTSQKLNIASKGARPPPLNMEGDTPTAPTTSGPPSDYGGYRGAPGYHDSGSASSGGSHGGQGGHRGHRGQGDNGGQGGHRGHRGQQTRHRGQSRGPPTITRRLYVDDEHVGFVIGAGGATVKRIKGQNHTSIKHFRREEGSEDQSGYFSIRGEERGIHNSMLDIYELVVESMRRKIMSLETSQPSLSAGASSYQPQSPEYVPSSPAYGPPPDAAEHAAEHGGEDEN